MDAVESVRESAEAGGGEIDDIRTVEPSLERLFLDLAQSEAPTGVDRRTDTTEA